MFKPRSPFGTPNVMKVEKKPKNYMSIQKQTKPEEKIQSKCYGSASKEFLRIKTGPSGTFDSQNPIRTGNIGQSRFAFDVLQADVDDSSVYWTYDLSSQVSNEYSRKIIFRQQQYFVRGVDEGSIVSNYSIGIQNIPGYCGTNGIQSNILCVLQLSQLSTNVDDVNIKSYDLLYKQTQDVVWDIPMNLSQLKLKIYADGVPMTGDLNVPLSLLFDVRHIGK